MKPFKIFILTVLLSILPNILFCQIIYSASFLLTSRQSFYSYEKNGEFLLHIPQSLSKDHISVSLSIGEETVASWAGIPGKQIVRLPFVLGLVPSTYKVEANIKSASAKGIVYTTSTDLRVLSYKPNEVKTDRLTGGLIVNKLPFFPFGFYCYSPVYPTMPEEEIVKGFNLMSPYQKIIPETFNERKSYMDRCAELGMKVHYNLLSVSGGGGVGSKIDGLSDEDKRKRLIDEIKTFRDHPALLGWYISDEPNGKKLFRPNSWKKFTELSEKMTRGIRCQ